MAFIAAALFASCSDDKDYSGDFGQIKVPDTRQLEQTVSADDTQSARGVTFTTEGAWTSTIAETRAEAPAWISISPDRGDAAGSYTLKITLEPNTSGASRTATIVITCGTSKIEITVTQEGADDPIEPMPANRITRIVHAANRDKAHRQPPADNPKQRRFGPGTMDFDQPLHIRRCRTPHVLRMGRQPGKLGRRHG